MDSFNPSSNANAISRSTAGPGSVNKPAALRNLQPRPASIREPCGDMDLDEEEGGLLGPGRKAQKTVTQDLANFFRSAPPPSPPRGAAQQRQTTSNWSATGGGGGGGEDDKKKRSLLQRLRPRKSTTSLSNSSNVGGGSSSSSSNGGNNTSDRRASVLMPSLLRTNSTVSSMSGRTTTERGKNGEEVTTATLPNGKKYIMIAVDYETEGGGASGFPSSSAVSTRQSRIPEAPEAGFLMLQGEEGGGTASKRTSMMSGTEGSKLLESGPFLLDSFALDTTGSFGLGEIGPTAQSKSASASSDLEQSLSSKAQTESNGMGVIPRSESRGASKVTFNTPANDLTDSVAADSVAAVAASGPHMDEATVAEALAQRIASHKTKQQHKSGDAGSIDVKAASTSTRSTSVSVSISTQDFLEIILPKPVSRKKVRHVQIQTQHCVMRPMHTQTEPFDSMAHDLDIKHWSGHPTATRSPRSVSSGNSTTEMGTSTACDAITTASPPSSPKKDAPTSPTNGGGLDFKGQPADAGADKDDELTQLRRQNGVLQAQVASLERDLAAETRARTRTAVAMQDTRDKFEMLSAMAYKKLKEMIFQRHVLEMEVRELRAQVDLQSEENVVRQSEILFRQEQLKLQMQQ